MSIITFQRGDKTALTKNFTKSEFECPCGCGQQSVDTELAEKLQLLRDKVDRPLRSRLATAASRTTPARPWAEARTPSTATAWQRTGGRRIGVSTLWHWASLLKPWGSAASASTGTAVGPLSTPTPVARKQRGSAPRRESTPARPTTSSCFPPSAGAALGTRTAVRRSCSRSS